LAESPKTAAQEDIQECKEKTADIKYALLQMDLLSTKVVLEGNGVFGRPTLQRICRACDEDIL
jgi:hypothetical protein